MKMRKTFFSFLFICKHKNTKRTYLFFYDYDNGGYKYSYYPFKKNTKNITKIFILFLVICLYSYHYTNK